MLDKDYYAAVDDYNAKNLKWYCKDRFQNGYFHDPVFEGSKIFEAIGIDSDVIDKYFTNTVSRIGGITLKDIENDVNELHSAAYDPLGLETDLTLDSGGTPQMKKCRPAPLQSGNHPSVTGIHETWRLQSVQTVHRACGQ